MDPPSGDGTPAPGGFPLRLFIHGYTPPGPAATGRKGGSEVFRRRPKPSLAREGVGAGEGASSLRKVVWFSLRGKSSEGRTCLRLEARAMRLVKGRAPGKVGWYQ